MLVFMVGGDVDAVARVRPVLEPLGRGLFHVGDLGLGNTMKLINSLIAFTTTWVSLEGLSMAAKAGIPVPAAVEMLRTAGASNFYLDRMVETIDQPRPSHPVRAGARQQGRRSHRRDRRRARACRHRSATPCSGCSHRRGRRRPRRSRLERAGRRSPSNRPAFSSAGRRPTPQRKPRSRSQDSR